MARDNTQYQLGQIFGILEGIKSDIADIKQTLKNSGDQLDELDGRIRRLEAVKQYGLGIVAAITLAFNILVTNVGDVISALKK